MVSVKKTPVILCVLDGWGVSNEPQGNAILSANTPCWDNLVQNYPYTELTASGAEVGLPDGQMGNSEVGHMTIAAGRVILQDLMKINALIKNSELGKAQCFQELEEAKEIHIFGLCSDGGVHAHIDHLLYITKLLSEKSKHIKLHLILDGRDVSPTSGLLYLKQIISECKEHKNISIATVCGRYYAMDRDQRLDRIEACYESIIAAKGVKTNDFLQSVEQNYANGITDEFIKPLVNVDYKGVLPDSALLITNFRADRVIQIASAFAGITKFNVAAKFDQLVAMKKYSDELDIYFSKIIQQEKNTNSLGQVVANNGLSQLRLAETEKYAHVTYFFNLGDQNKYNKEDRLLVSSPNVSDYLDTPSMSSSEITDKLIDAINNSQYDMILVNFAAPDMIGHTGDMQAAIEAVEAIDSCLSKIYDVVLEKNATLVITADHGNCEAMFDSKGNAITAHTTNKVPLVVVKKDLLKKSGYLCKAPAGLKDIAPTILEILGLDKPREMSGRSLIVNNKRNDK